MFRYKLRTLLIVLALAPPVLAGAWLLRELLLAAVPVALLFLVFVGFLPTGEQSQEKRRPF